MSICLRRRDFIAGLGGAAALPLAARPQPGDRVRRIGVLMPYDENDPEWKTRFSAFTQALADLGWADGRNLRMDLRWHGDDTNRIPALAKDLVGLRPDIILTGSTPATIALQRETPTVPISPSPAASSPGLTARVGTSPASPSWKPRWEASGLSCSRRSRPGSSGPPSFSTPTRSPRRFICPHLRRRPGHSRSCQSSTGI